MKTLLLLLLFLPGCGAFMQRNEEGLQGLKYEKVVEILQILIEELPKYDLNKDGLITIDEAVPLGFSATNLLYMEMRRVDG